MDALLIGHAARCWADRTHSTVCFMFAVRRNTTTVGSKRETLVGARGMYCRFLSDQKTKNAALTITMVWVPRSPSPRCAYRWPVFSDNAVLPAGIPFFSRIYAVIGNNSFAVKDPGLIAGISWCSN